MISSFNELKNQSLVSIEYPNNLRSSVEKAVHSWIDFCKLPNEEKLSFTFLEDNHSDGSGYELKEEKASKKDLKENFHVTLFQYSRLAEIANKRTFAFLNDAKNLLDHMEPLILEFSKMVEDECKIEGFVEEVKASKPHWILRYLHYFGDQPEGAEIAAPHVDKGGFTLHLYESDEGLEHYCLVDLEWKPMPVAKDQTVIIPAIQLQLKSEGQLKALYHRVVATDKTSKTGRFSMVCFVPLQRTPMYNKKNYGSLQIHDVAFNYKISHNQLLKLFLPKT